MVAAVCFAAADVLSYQTVSLLLLFSVSILAMLFDIWPVVLASVLSAFIWNFFFIPPIFTFHIGTTTDWLMFLLYFLIALVNAVLSYKIRIEEAHSRAKEDKARQIMLYNTLLNSLSHELRTPLATLIGAIDTLKESQAKLSIEQQHALFEQIDIASLRLNRQVENLLNMSRFESGVIRLNPDWCDIHDLIHQVIAQQAPTDRARIECQADESLPLIRFDRGFIEQVLLNLIHNALQYTPANSPVYMEVKYDKGHCLFRVSDRGKGIPEAHRKLVFDKFYRLPNSPAGGSGLGLSIVKAYVEAHQGHIEIEDNSFGGATFLVKIPAESSFMNQIKHE